MTRRGTTWKTRDRRFTAIDNRNETREILSSVYDSLKVKGYNPINQLVGYIISEDPTYITNYNNARSLICRLDQGRAAAGTARELPREVKNQKSYRANSSEPSTVPPQARVISSLAGSAVQMDST